MIPRHDAIVFDMDGLLIDSESITLKASLQTYPEFGYENFTADMYLQTVGRNQVDTEKLLKSILGQELPYKKIRERREEKFFNILKTEGMPLKPGVEELLLYLKEAKIPYALATSTWREKCSKILALTGLENHFEFTVCGDEIENGKPAPDIYMAAAEKINVAPQDCLALEDSENGVLSAVAAKMHVCMIPDLIEPKDELIEKGVIVLPSLHDVLAAIS